MIREGDVVRVNYEGRLEDGEVFDSSYHGDHSHPLEFVVGSGEVIKGFDEAVIGMSKGEIKEFILKPSEAYGEKNPELIKEFSRELLPKNEVVESGMSFNMVTPQGNLPVVIQEISDETITLDLNHPLAGKELIFKIEIVEVIKKD